MSTPLIAEFITLAALWGASFLLMHLGTAEFGVLPAAGLRVVFGAVFLLPILLISKIRQQFLNHIRPILFVGVLNSALPFALYAFAVLHISTGLSAILNATVPLSGALVAWCWLNDRPNRVRALGLIVGFVGVIMLVWGRSGSGSSMTFGASNHVLTLLSTGACLLATLCYGLAASFTKRYLSGVHPMAIATGSQIGATLLLVVPMVWFWPSHTVSATAWWALVAVGVMCTAIAYVLFFRIIDRAGPSKALAVTFLVPVFAVVYGVIFLQETLTLWTLVCGTVILMGTALSTGFVRWTQR